MNNSVNHHKYSELGYYLFKILRQKYKIIDINHTQVNQCHERYVVDIKELKHWKINIWISTSNTEGSAFLAYMSHNDYPKHNNPIDAYYCTGNEVCKQIPNDTTEIAPVINFCNMIDTVIKHRITAYAHVCNSDTNMKYHRTDYVRMSIYNWYMRHKEKYIKKKDVKFISKTVKNTISDYKNTVSSYELKCVNDTIYLDISISHNANENDIVMFKRIISSIVKIYKDIIVTYYETKKVE